jgi:hypothetical protein
LTLTVVVNVAFLKLRTSTGLPSLACTRVDRASIDDAISSLVRRSCRDLHGALRFPILIGLGRKNMTTRRFFTVASLLATPLLLRGGSALGQISEMPPTAKSEAEQIALDAYVYG